MLWISHKESEFPNICWINGNTTRFIWWKAICPAEAAGGDGCRDRYISKCAVHARSRSRRAVARVRERFPAATGWCALLLPRIGSSSMAAFKISGPVIVIRFCPLPGCAETAKRFWSAIRDMESGKIDAVCPSLPAPRIMASKRGIPCRWGSSSRTSCA